MKVPSTDAQNNFGKYLKYAEAGEEIIVTRKGKDVARIVPCESPGGGLLREGAAEYAAGSVKMSYEDFLELSEKSEQRFELIDGVVYNLASPTFNHQRIVGDLHVIFYNWLKGKSCVVLVSPFDVTLFRSEDNPSVVQPDLLVMCDRQNINAKGKYKGTPTLVVEVLSVSTRSKDMLVKLDLYMQTGVREYWVVNPFNEEIHVYKFEDGELTDNKAFTRRAADVAVSFCFESLQVELESLFAEISI
jgi:prevent-host-death family protein